MLIKRKLHHLISGQLPEFVRAEYPQFVTFLEHYYKFLENQGEAHDVLLSNMDWMDIDETLDVFIPYFKNQFTYDMPSDTVIDNRRLIKYINQYYEAKGSETATEMFFRFMFNDTATVKYPGDYLLRASDGRWSRKRFIKVDTTLFQDENIFELKEKVITLYYLEYIEGAGNFVRTITTRCLDVYETSRPNIYQLQVDINPNYQFPDDISADITIASSLGNFDTHVYVQHTEDDDTTTYGTISKQLTSVLNVDEPGSNFRRDDTFFVSETGIEGLYFAGDYTDVTTGSAAYAFELLQNNAIVRVVKTENTFVEQYFLEDYTLFGDYASAPTRGKIKLLSIVDSGEKFLVRKTGVIESVTILDGGSGYAVGATAVNLIGDGSGAEFRVLVSNGKITQVTVVNGGANYSEEINPSTGLPLTSLTASGSGTGAVFEVNIATGYTPVKTFTVDFNNGRSGSSRAEITFATGHIYHAPGEYVDNAGFLSDNIKIQDNDYYQPYSYVIETREQLSNWKTTYLKSSHPAGFKMFSNLLLTGDITPPEVVVQEEFAQVNVEDLPYRALEETVTTSEDVAKAISRPVTTDTVSVSDVAEVFIVYLQSLSDTVSTADTTNVDFNQQDDATSDLQEDVGLNDVTAFTFDNVIVDSQFTEDGINSIDTELGKFDEVITDDVFVKNVDFTLSDSQNTVDSLTTDTTISLSDNVSTSDSLDLLIVIPIELSDSVNITETVAKSKDFSFSEHLSTNTGLDIFFNQVHDDTSELSDSTAFDIDYVIPTDTSELSDSTAFDIDYVIPTDTITVSDPNVLEAQKNVSDTQTVTDAGGTIWVDSYFENGRFSASPYVAGDYVGDGYSL